MNLIPQILFKTTCLIMDADVSPQMTAVLLKGKGEKIIVVNGEERFTVTAHAYMIRILGEGLVIYNGKELQFFTLDGTCTQHVTVGQHVFDFLPMKDAIVVTYRDQGVYGDSIGQEKIIVVKMDGTVTSQLSFANEHHLNFDIHFARVKPYACIGAETNKILHFNEDFQLLKAETCPFELGNVIAMSYQYPNFLFLEKGRCICLDENGACQETKQSFSYNIRSSYYRGPFVFLEILEQEVIGYSFAEY